MIVVDQPLFESQLPAGYDATASGSGGADESGEAVRTGKEQLVPPELRNAQECESFLLSLLVPDFSEEEVRED